MTSRSNSPVTSMLIAMIVGMLAMCPALRAADPAYPESAEGMKKLAQDILTALKDGKTDAAAALIKPMALPDSDAWFTKTFGDTVGKALGADYKKQAAELEPQILKLFEAQLKLNRTNITSYKLEKADDENGTGAQKKSIAAMQNKVPLYGFRLIEPGKDAGMHLWSFVHVDGQFRYVGKLQMK